MKIPRDSNLFLDANLIVDYLILDGLTKDNIQKISRNIRMSHELIQKLLAGKHSGHVCSSRLILLESFSAIVDAYLSKKMFLDNVSLRYFDRLKGKYYKLSDSDIADIISLIKEFEEKAKGRIEIVDINIDEDWIQDRSSQFIFNYFSVSDAIHLQTAETFGANYFVTRDRDFLDNKKLVSKLTDIMILHPKEVEF